MLLNNWNWRPLRLIILSVVIVDIVGFGLALNRSLALATLFGQALRDAQPVPIDVDWLQLDYFSDALAILTHFLNHQDATENQEDRQETSTGVNTDG
mmetsp:Transcript_30677/g.40809  ORF Transcript_30677/g.40809 Transcript_30677/m.40809 type:complete len:97 (-) Transcript_30677:664-954(-)